MTKIIPIVAVPCLICIALLQRDTGLAWFYCAAALFVVIAVPLKSGSDGTADRRTADTTINLAGALPPNASRVISPSAGTDPDTASCRWTGYTIGKRTSARS